MSGTARYFLNERPKYWKQCTTFTLTPSSFCKHAYITLTKTNLNWLEKEGWVWFYISSNFQWYFAKNQNIIHRNSKLVGDIRSLPIAACSLCFHDVVRNFFQLKHSQNILQLVFFYHQTICKTSWTDESKCNYSCSVKLNTNQFFQKNIYLVK